jgi:alkyl hydroperoxide reductase subunit AhpC
MVCFVSHPADFTPVCTTELGTVANYFPEFEKEKKVIALSGWIRVAYKMD